MTVMAKIRSVVEVSSATTELVIDVVGDPVPQGSKTTVVKNGRHLVIEDNANALRAWRKQIAKAAKARMAHTGITTFDGPVDVEIVFFMTRPAAAAERAYPHVRPDVDKLIRAIFDACTYAGVWSDDSRVVDVRGRKRYAGKTAGVRITVRPMRWGLS